jgi:hypothetical protein
MPDAVNGTAQAITLSMYAWQEAPMVTIQMAFDVNLCAGSWFWAGFLSVAEEGVEFEGRSSGLTKWPDSSGERSATQRP